MENKIIVEAKGYGIVQRDFMTMDISVHAKCVYTLLRTYSGEKTSCYPSLKTICDDLRVSKPTVIKAIKELEDIKMIAVRRSLKKDSKESSVNVYIPLSVMVEIDLQNHDSTHKEGSLGGKGDLPRSKGRLPRVVKEVDSKNNSYKNNKEDIHTEQGSASMSDKDKGEYYVDKINSTILINGDKRKFKSSDTIVNSLKKILKDYSLSDILKAVRSAMSQEYHFKNQYKYLTPSFFLRRDKLEMYLNMSHHDETVKKENENVYENPYDMYGPSN